MRSPISRPALVVNRLIKVSATTVVVAVTASNGWSQGNAVLLHQKDGAVAGDNLGSSVAGVGDVNGDGKSDFIIGAWYAAPGGRAFAGSAYVYSGDDGSLLYQKDGFTNSQVLGVSVAGAGLVNGDSVPDFLIGGSGNNGSAYVYSGTDGSLVYQKFGIALNDFFGQSVASAGDADGDGRDDFIIGAPLADPGLSAAGSAYLYSGASGALLYQKNGASNFSSLGNSVASAGDVNGDGRADFIIGAVGVTFGSGAAYVYSGIDSSLIYPKNGSGAEGLGGAVSSAGDVNGDGKDDFIVGASSADPGGLADAGTAYIYSGADGSLLHQKDGSDPDDRLGFSVASAGDVDDDGRSDFIIGAPGADPGGLADAGSAYIFSGADGSLLYQIDGSTAGDSLGYSVASAGDVNGDGRPDFIVGAYRADPGGRANAGSAYVYGPVATSVSSEDAYRPARFNLHQNFPNPFNPSTKIRYSLSRPDHVTLEIYNIMGQRVKTEFVGEQAAGEHSLTWDGTDNLGKNLPSGIYFYRLVGKETTPTRKMTLVK